MPLFSDCYTLHLQAISKGTIKKIYQNVTKAQVVNQIAEKTGIEKADVHKSLEAFFQVVKNTMSKGENIYVRGFGSFVVKKRAKKVARNISKNTAIIIDEHYVPSFKPAKVFMARVKSNDKVTANGVDKK